MLRAIAVLVMGLLSFSVHADDGLIRVKSSHSVKETADKVESIASKTGLRLMARIDHQRNAEGADLTLRPTELILFGNPKSWHATYAVLPDHGD